MSILLPMTSNEQFRQGMRKKASHNLAENVGISFPLMCVPEIAYVMLPEDDSSNTDW